MKSILLASVATVALAGAAAAEITWSGTGSVSIGRTGSVAAVAGTLSNDQALEYLATTAAATTGLTTAQKATVDAAEGSSATAAEIAAGLAVASEWVTDIATAAQLKAGVTASAGDKLVALDLEEVKADLATVQAWLAAHASWEDSDTAMSATTTTDVTILTAKSGLAGNITIDEDGTSGEDLVVSTSNPAIVAIADTTQDEVWTAVKEVEAKLKVHLLEHNNVSGAAAVAAGDTVMTATGTLTAAMTVGDDYVASLSFNAGTGAFGALSLAHPDMGTLTFSPNKIAATVDASDKGGDLKYTNTVGGWPLL